MQIVINTPFTFNGQLYQRGEPIVDDATGQAMVDAGLASFKVPQLTRSVKATQDASGNITGLYDPDGTTIGVSRSMTFAQLKTQADAGFVGTAFVTDVSGGSLWLSDGTTIKPLGGEVTLAKWSMPTCVPSSGTMANNGAITLTTGLDKIYSNGIYLFLPANAIFAGSAAGSYYTVMSTTQVGQVYNNVYTSGAPVAPTTLVPFVTTGPGAYTQVVGSDFTLVNIPILANLLGRSGGLQNTHTLIMNSNANIRTFKQRYGAYVFYDVSYSNNSIIAGLAEFVNSSVSTQKGVTAVNVSLGLTTGIVQTQSTGAIDSTTLQNYTQTVQIATATDWMIISSGKLILSI